MINWLLVAAEMKRHVVMNAGREVFGIIFKDGKVLRCPDVPSDMGASIKLFRERVQCFEFDSIEGIYTSHVGIYTGPTFRDFAQATPGKRYLIASLGGKFSFYGFRGARQAVTGHPYLVPEAVPFAAS